MAPKIEKGFDPFQAKHRENMQALFVALCNALPGVGICLFLFNEQLRAARQLYLQLPQRAGSSGGQRMGQTARGRTQPERPRRRGGVMLAKGDLPTPGSIASVQVPGGYIQLAKIVENRINNGMWWTLVSWIDIRRDAEWVPSFSVPKTDLSQETAP